MTIVDMIKIGFHAAKTEGIHALLIKTYGYFNRNGAYKIWMKKHEQRATDIVKMEYEPLISIVIPVYNVPAYMLEECINSVRSQIYQNYELILVDDCSTQSHVKDILNKHEKDERTKVIYRDHNGHISEATNTGIEQATGEYIGLVDCDDLLAPNALYENIKMLNYHRYDYIYSDEDKITEDGKKRKDPAFKPEWSPDALMSLMYTSHFSLFRTDLCRSIGGMRVGMEGCQDYDFVLRLTELTDNIGHIPQVLYHWRERKGSTALDMSAKQYIDEHQKKMKLDALERRNLAGYLEKVESLAQYRVVYTAVGTPKISIIILSKDNYEILRQCVDSIASKSTYQNYEIVLVDNGSTEKNRLKYEELSERYKIKYVYHKCDFNFSAMCNLGATNANGEVLLFLNDDIEVVTLDWLERMVGQAMLPHEGAVGAKLLYPNSNLIQHDGIISITEGPAHAFYQMSDDSSYYFGRNKLEYNWSAVTGACFMIKREKFREAKGFREDFPINYNDIELSFHLLKLGYYNTVRNDVVLIHHESLSRGIDKQDERKEQLRKKQAEKLYELYPEYKRVDHFYSPNLVQSRGDFGINID